MRLFTDGWAPDRPATDPDDLVLQVEFAASRRDPYRRLSRLFRLVAVPMSGTHDPWTTAGSRVVRRQIKVSLDGFL